MFFYVDESGHTGTKLFDPKQPRLYYGALSCHEDLNHVAKQATTMMKITLGERRLHATDLGVEKMVKLIPSLMLLQESLGLCFDVYTVEKRDHPIICFFDQVFDSGLNKAVPMTGYWTPLRYMLLMKLGYLFSPGLREKAWDARIEKDELIATPLFLEVCESLGQRVGILPDARSRQLVGDALEWAAKHPEAIGYNCASEEQILDIAPNMIGFQFVLAGIASRIPHHSGATEIIVDQQSQFNRSQASLSKAYASMRNIDPSFFGRGMPTMDVATMPSTPLQFRSSRRSAGLELTDLYLWVFKRFLEGETLPRDFDPLIESQIGRGNTNGLSLNGITERWSKFFSTLPDPTGEQLKFVHEFLESQEQRRLDSMSE